jgi:hypothetical protein
MTDITWKTDDGGMSFYNANPITVNLENETSSDEVFHVTQQIAAVWADLADQADEALKRAEERA